jgi:alpha-L-fucosidase 2
MYKFGAATRVDTPPITLQGPWTADTGKIPPWRGDYHHDLNTELSYWPSYAGNHLDSGQGFVDWLWDTKSTSKSWTERFFELPGLNVPMTADINNEQIGGWHQYTHSATTAAWLAHHFWLQWRYSMDREFLADRAYPFLTEVSVFMEAVTELDENGERTLPLSSSPEVNDNRLDAWFPTITNYDLALISWLWEHTAILAEEMDEPRAAEHWRSLAQELPEQAVDPESEGLLVAKDYPLTFSHRHFSHLMAIHPLGLIDGSDGPSARRVIRGSLADLEKLGTDWWTGYSFSWVASFYARALDGENAAEYLRKFATSFRLRNSFHVNGDQSGKGYSKFTYRPFTLEGNFAAASSLMEMLIQSHTGVVRLFPAIPKDWDDCSFKTLRTEGAFLVSAERAGGKTTRVEIVSEKGGRFEMLNPFGESFASHGAKLTKDGLTLVAEFEPGQKLVIENR